MGIYDRDYVFKRSGGGLGSVRAMSVNAWIIAINIAVFFLGVLFSGKGVPVFLTMKDPWPASQAMPEKIAIATGYQEQPGGTDIDPTSLTGSIVFKTVIDASTGAIVNSGVYRVMPFFNAYGHFSTSRIVGYEREDRGWVLTLEVWRLITFQFLHADLLHLGFNMLGLYMFGGLVEQQLGSKRYLSYYLACGVFGGIAYLLLNAIGFSLHTAFDWTIPGLLIHLPTTPLIGASAGVFGVIVACAYIAPDLRVQLLFPPIPMRLKTMAYAYVGLAAINLFFGSSNAGGEAAHLGGAISGFFLIRNSHLLRDFFDVLGNSRLTKKSSANLRLARDDNPPKPTKDPFDAEVDRILEKIQKVGTQGLSDSEKQTLQKATQRGRSGR